MYTREQLRRWHTDTTLGKLFDDIDDEGSDGAFLQFNHLARSNSNFALIVIRTPITEDDFIHIVVEGAHQLIHSGRLEFTQMQVDGDED